jgi:hypothetical protein
MLDYVQAAWIVWRRYILGEAAGDRTLEEKSSVAHRVPDGCRRNDEVGLGGKHVDPAAAPPPGLHRHGTLPRYHVVSPIT